MEEPKLIEIIKPQLFNFKIKSNKNTTKQTNRNSNQRSQSINLGHEHDANFFASEQLQWKPKIPTKKLYQQPKFLISIQRRKLRGISEIKDLQIFEQIERQKIPKDRIKIKHQTIQQKKQTSPLKQDKNDTHYIHTQFSLPKKNPQKQCKALIVNFNLQHLIEKRKKFKSLQNSPKKYSLQMSPQKTIENKIQNRNDLQINLNIINCKIDRPLTYTNIRRKSSNKNKTWYQSSRAQILHILQ